MTVTFIEPYKQMQTEEEERKKIKLEHVQIIEALSAAGMRKKAIAREVGISYAALKYSMQQGKGVRFSTLQRLRALLQRLTEENLNTDCNTQETISERLQRIEATLDLVKETAFEVKDLVKRKQS